MKLYWIILKLSFGLYLCALTNDNKIELPVVCGTHRSGHESSEYNAHWGSGGDETQHSTLFGTRRPARHHDEGARIDKALRQAGEDTKNDHVCVVGRSKLVRERDEQRANGREQNRHGQRYPRSNFSGHQSTQKLNTFEKDNLNYIYIITNLILAYKSKYFIRVVYQYPQ